MTDKKGITGFGLTVGGLILFTAVAGCPLKTLTGIPCPACGMTRACLYALTGDLDKALAFHPLFFTAPWILWLMYAETVKPPVKKRRLHVQLVILAGAMVLIWLERIWLFPHGPISVELSGGWLERTVRYFINLRGKFL